MLLTPFGETKKAVIAQKPIKGLVEDPNRASEQEGEPAMEANEEESPAVKGRKSRAPKAASRKVTKVKASLMLTEDVDFRLTVHAAAMKLDRSGLVNQILDGALKRYVVQDRGQNRGGEGPSDESGTGT